MPKSFFSSKDPIFNNKLDINKTTNIDYSNVPRNAVIAPTATLVGAKFIDGFRNKKFSKGKLGKLALLASLLGGASGVRINESTNVKVKPKAFSFDNIIQKTEQPKINNIEDLNKLYLAKLTRTLGGGALGYTLGSLLSIGADENSFRNILPYLLGLGGAGLGYAYKDYKLNTNNLKQLSNDISNKINSWFNKTASSDIISNSMGLNDQLNNIKETLVSPSTEERISEFLNKNPIATTILGASLGGLSSNLLYRLGTSKKDKINNILSILPGAALGGGLALSYNLEAKPLLEKRKLEKKMIKSIVDGHLNKNENK